VIVDTNLAAGTNTIKIRLSNDFGVGYAGHLPALGSANQGLRIISESWSDSRDTLTLHTEGVAGRTYALSIWGKGQIKSIEGARLTTGDMIEEVFGSAAGATDSQEQTVTIHFVNARKQSKLEESLRN
jgi:hypothetical protein